MDLLPDEAQQEIIDATAAFLDDAMPIERLHGDGTAAARPDAAGLTQMAELGWFGLSLDEEQGGVGFTLVEEALLFRESGRRVGAVQLLATALAARVAVLAGDTERAEALIAGRQRAGWAEAIETATLGSEVSGRFQVFAGAGADSWIAADETGAALLDPITAATTEGIPCLDEFTDLHHASFANTAPLASVGAGDAIVDRAAVLAAAMSTGVAESARDQGATYAQERFQFGKPIGIFQAVKHPCADMAVRCEAAWSQTAYAALALRDGTEDAGFHVSCAKHLADEAARENAAANLQIHGGYGFTVEYDAHLFVKRAHVLAAMAGSSRRHLGRVLAAPAQA